MRMPYRVPTGRPRAQIALCPIHECLEEARLVSDASGLKSTVLHQNYWNYRLRSLEKTLEARSAALVQLRTFKWRRIADT